MTWGYVPSVVLPFGQHRGPGQFLRRASVRETGDMDSMSGISRGISDLSEWIDEANSQLPPEAATWARLAKITEEAGEVVTAHIGATGQNPRKGVTHTRADVEEELLDVALTALAALEHLRGHDRSEERRVGKGCGSRWAPC